MDIINPLHVESNHTDQQRELEKTSTLLPGLELRQLLGTFTRQHKIIVLITALIMGGTLLALSVIPERYTASAMIVIDESESQLLGVEAVLSAGATLNNRVDTEAEVLKSPSVALRVIDKLKLWTDEEFGLAPSLVSTIWHFITKQKFQDGASVATIQQLTDDQRAKLVDRLTDSLDISRRGFTSVISVEATSKSAEKSAKIANAIADAYFDLQIDARTQGAQRAATFLRARVDELAAAIRQGNKRLDQFMLEHGGQPKAGEGTEVGQLRKVPATDDQGLQEGESVDLYRLQRDVETNRKLYESYVSRLGEVQQQVNLALPNSRLVSPAIAPHEPSFPPRFILLGLAAVFGLAFGGGAAMLREHIVGGFASPEQLEAVTGIPITAVVPHYGDQNPQDAILRSPFSAFAESIRRLKIGIENATEGSRSRVVLITSTEPGEGKSTIAVALARAIARSHQRTLLIDCDLRHSSVGKLVNEMSPMKVVDLLLSPTMEEQFNLAVGEEKESGLFLLNADTTKQHASDVLLGSDNFRKLIEIARMQFDAIVIDSPPVGYVVDASIISRECDIVVYVIRFAAASQRNVIAGLREILNKPKSSTLAVVLNGAKEALSYRVSKYNDYYTSPTA